jgi:hypothetical protein
MWIGMWIAAGNEPASGAKLLISLAAPQGFEPRYADPESAVLPLNEGAAISGWPAHMRCFRVLNRF